MLPSMLYSIDPVLPCGAGHTRLVQITPLQRPLAPVSLGTGLASHLKASRGTAEAASGWLWLRGEGSANNQAGTTPLCGWFSSCSMH